MMPLRNEDWKGFVSRITIINEMNQLYFLSDRQIIEFPNIIERDLFQKGTETFNT